MRALARLGATLAALFALACLGVAAAGLPDRPAPADVAVVLGARVHRDGRMSRSLVLRCERAVAVYRAGLAPRVLVSGGLDPGERDQAQAMRAYLLAHGVPDSAVIADPHGTNTWHTAADTRAFLTAHGLRRALLVSQFYHLPRCRLAFARWGVVPAGWTYPHALEWHDLYATAREVPALVKYALRPAPPVGAPAPR